MMKNLELDGMKKRSFISVIVPAYNEEKNIELAVDEVKKVLDNSPWSYEIIIVDDGSKDKTYEISKNTGSKILKHEVNQGKGFAIRDGIKLAKGDIIVIQDADLTISAKTIPSIIKKITGDNYDAAYATRLAGKVEDGSMPLYRIFGNILFAKILSLITGQKLTDTLSGQKGFKRQIFEKMNIETSSWPDFEILIKSSKMGFKTTEIQVDYFRRREGKSKMKVINHGIWLFLEIIKWVLK
jgi:glycosyltransferase involved in cell wall biosynthesis